MEEVWKPIPGVDNYEVSSEGRARVLDRTIFYKDGRVAAFKGRELSSMRGSSGYITITLPKGERARIHRLVAELFLPKPVGCDFVNHKNGDKHDNRVENLEWVTVNDNNRHARETGLNRQHGEACNLTTYSAQLIAALKRVHTKFDCSNRELALIFDMSETQVGDIVRGRTRARG